MEYSNADEPEADPCSVCGGSMYYMWVHPGMVKMHRSTDEFLCPEMIEKET
jgi:hypothetical protein